MVMKVKIISVEDAGDIERERIILSTRLDATMSSFAVLACTVTRVPDETGSMVSAIKTGDLPATYWFGPFEVKKGDLIVLYSKAGRMSQKEGASGKKSHFNYWGRSQPLWTRETKPVLIQISDWIALEHNNELTEEPLSAAGSRSLPPP
jgi:hypothetical protein